MARLTVHTPFNIDLEFAVAPILKRGAAYAIDLLITAAYAFIISNTVISKAASLDELLDASQLFLLVLPIYGYHLACELLMNGQSLGKKIMGIRVVNESGNAAGISQFLLRWILSIPNLASVLVAYSLLYNPGMAILIGVLALPDLISMAISETGKRIGDRAANTVVIDLRYRSDIEHTIFREVATKTDYVPKFPEVMQLTDKDINTLRNLLSQKRTSDLNLYVDRVARRIEEVLNIHNNSMDAYYFFEELLHDYNFITQQQSNRS